MTEPQPPNDKDKILDSKDRGRFPTLVVFVKENVDAEKQMLKPWWYYKLDELSKSLDEFRGEKTRITEYQTDSETKIIPYPENVDEAIAGNWQGRKKHLAWKQQCSVQFGPPGLPDSEEKAVNQLRISSWWIGDKEGANEETVDELIRISKLETDEFPEQAKSRFASDPATKDRNLEKLKKFGNDLKSWDGETITIEHQKVYWSRQEGKPVPIPQFSVRISKKLDGQYEITIEGQAFGQQDRKSYKIGNPSMGEAFVKQIETSLDRASERQAKTKKGPNGK